MANKTQKTRLFYKKEAAYVFVPGLTSIGFPERSGDDIDLTDLDSDGMEFCKGLIDSGTLAQELNLDTSNPAHRDLIDLDISGETVEWKIEFPESRDPAVTTASTIVFEGYINGLSGTHGVNDKQTRTMNIRVTGDYTPAYGQPRQAIA